jgi:hypothetical protein
MRFFFELILFFVGGFVSMGSSKRGLKQTMAKLMAIDETDRIERGQLRSEYQETRKVVDRVNEFLIGRKPSDRNPSPINFAEIWKRLNLNPVFRPNLIHDDDGVTFECGTMGDVGVHEVYRPGAALPYVTHRLRWQDTDSGGILQLQSAQGVALWEIVFSGPVSTSEIYNLIATMVWCRHPSSLITRGLWRARYGAPEDRSLMMVGNP